MAGVLGALASFLIAKLECYDEQNVLYSLNRSIVQSLNSSSRSIVLVVQSFLVEVSDSSRGR